MHPVSGPLGAARRESKLPRARSALRQVPIPGFLFVKGGRAPLSHFPPSHAGSEPEVRCHQFLGVSRGSPPDREEARGRRRHERGARAPRFHAARRCAPKIETSSRAKRATASSDSWFSFCERGASPPFTLSPQSRRQRTRGSLPLFLARAAKRRLQNAARRHGNADLPAVAVKMQVPRVRQRSGWRRRSGNAHQNNWADLRSASRRAGTGTPDLRSAALREAQPKACTGPPFG